MKNYSANLNIVLEAISISSEKIIKNFYDIKKVKIYKKGVDDFVTDIDLEVEEILITHLQRSRTTYSFITEESGNLESIKNPNFNQAVYKWIIDPIDGTFNFMHGIPFFCISIALLRILKGKATVILGVICNPISKEIFWAEKGKGSFLIDRVGVQRKIKVSVCTDYKKVTCVTNNYSSTNSKLKKYLNFVCLKYSKIKIFGSSALEMAYLADGRINIFIQDELNLWDYAAGLIIIKEAGGVVKGLYKNSLNINLNDVLIAGSEELVSDIEKNS